MIRRRSKIPCTLFPLLIAGILLTGFGAWACSDGCAHPLGTRHAEDSESGTSSSTGDGGSVCGQEDGLIGSLPDIRFPTGAWRSDIPADESVVSREGTEIFHPPLA